MPQSDLQRRPTLLNSCAKAATATEARFRIGYPFPPRDSRVLALDAGAAAVVCRAARRHWTGTARFLTFDPPLPDPPNGAVADPALRCCDGSRTRLGDELAGADVAVMVASSAGAAAAAVVGRACAERRIMTAGVVLAGPGGPADGAVLGLRPYAMVLVVSDGEDDLLDLLTALRA